MLKLEVFREAKLFVTNVYPWSSTYCGMQCTSCFCIKSDGIEDESFIFII